MAVKVLIKPGAGVPDFKPQYEEILRAAFHEWEDISGSKIKFEFVTNPPANITCQFVQSIPKQKPSVAGLTSYQTSPYHIDSALISIKTNCSIRKLTDELMHSVCLHEIGHALGLMNHSLDPHDIMYPFLATQRNLSSRDIKTIKLLYEEQPPAAILQLAREPQRDPNYPFGLIVLSSEDYDAYTRKVVVQLIKHFTPTPARPMLECSVRCFVDSTGNIFNYRIFESSMNDAFDKKAMSSLLSALPLPPAPVSIQKNKWSKAPIALRFRSDGWIVPYVEPDPNQSDWLKINEEPTPDEMLKELDRSKGPAPKIVDPPLEPWVVSVSEKAHSAWKNDGHGKAEMILGIDSQGRVAHLVLARSSGDDGFDNSALNACMSAEPYPIPPTGSKDTVEVNLLFEN